MNRAKDMIGSRTPAVLLCAAFFALAGCDSMLEVENPAAIADEDLNVAQLATTLANSSRNEVQRQVDDLMTVSAIITDEAVNGHNFIQWKEMDLRQLRDDNDLGYWGAIHRMRWLADTNSVRLENILGENGAKDRRVAESYAYAGYTYVIAGEFMCESPINVSKQVYTPVQLTEMAIPRLEKAIAVATASKVGATAAQVTQADNIINFAKVVLGRAYLYMGDPAKAAAAVVGVPANFVWNATYSANSGGQNNEFYGRTTGSNRSLGVDPSFRGLNDRRIRHLATPVKGHDNATDQYTPYQPPSHSGFTGTSNVAWARDTGIRLASGLEAQYITAEAAGPTTATLDFVNARRAVGGLTAVTLTGSELMAELRDQRRRDFFLDGHRLGDLRRYKRTGVGDFFPKGTHPTPEYGTYGAGECLQIPRAEKIGNPGLGG